MREQLRFPSGTATAEMIAVLNKSSIDAGTAHPIVESATDGRGEYSGVVDAAGNAARWGILAKTFALSGCARLHQKAPLTAPQLL